MLQDPARFNESIESTHIIFTDFAHRTCNIPMNFTFSCMFLLYIGRRFYCSTKVQYLPPIILQVTLPQSYPSESPPEVHLVSSWLDDAKLATITDHLQGLWQNTAMPILYTWMDWLQNNTLRFVVKVLILTEGTVAYIAFLNEYCFIMKGSPKLSYMESKRLEYQLLCLLRTDPTTGNLKNIIQLLLLLQARHS